MDKLKDTKDTKDNKTYKNSCNIKFISYKALLKKYGAMVTKIVESIDMPYQYKDDAKQDAYLALLQAKKTYNSSLSTFSTYAWLKIYRAVIASVYKSSYSYGMSDSFYYQLIKKNHHIKTESIQNNNIDNIDNIDNIETDIIQQPNYSIISLFCKKINMKYSQAQCEVIIDYYIDGLSYKELRAKYGNISRIVNSIDLKQVFKECKKELEEIDIVSV
jgi:RNA polymerase sigma factor (sigma-70 family)